ncbi:MAG: tetratricopeptide repeat protein [Bacteroidota bacterium]
MAQPILKRKLARSHYHERIKEIHEFAVKNHATDPERVIDLLQEAIDLSREINDIPMLLKSMYRRAYGLRVQLRLDEALCVLHSALKIAENSEFKSETGIVYNNIAHYYYALGKYSEAKDFFLKHSGIYAELGEYQGQVESLATVALMSTHEGKLSEALTYCQQGFGICESHGIETPVHLLYNTATIYSNVGEIQKALEYYFAALEIAERLNSFTLQAITLGAISTVYQENGDAEVALEYSSRALALHDKFINPAEKVLILAMMADNLESLNRLDEAESHLEQAWEIVRGKNLRPKELRLLIASAALALKKGQDPEALQLLQNALVLAEEIQANRDKVKILLETGKLSSSAELLMQALQTAQEIGFKASVPEIYHALYDHYERSGDIQAAFDNYKLFHTVKQEIHGEDAIRRMQVVMVQHEAEKARKDALNMRLKSELLEYDARVRIQQLNDLKEDAIQKNQVLSEIKQNTQEALRQHGLKQQQTLRTIIKTAEEGATTFWQQLEDRSRLVEGEFAEKILQICPDLTPTELRIILLLKNGMSNKEISHLLFLAERTIEYHRTLIRKKLQLKRTDTIMAYLNSL